MRSLIAACLFICISGPIYAQTYRETYTLKTHRPRLFRPYYSETVIIERKYSPVPNYRPVHMYPIYIVKPWCCW